MNANELPNYQIPCHMNYSAKWTKLATDSRVEIFVPDELVIAQS